MKLVADAGRSRRGIGVGIAAAVLFLVGTRPVWGEVESVQPSTGTVVQGSSTVATVQLSAALGCVSALPSNPTIIVTFGGLPTSCGVGPRSVSMTVLTTAATPVGSQQITIDEVNSITLGIDSHNWPLQVLASAPTTTTTTTTTVPAPTTTTSPPITTTTTGPSPTTTIDLVAATTPTTSGSGPAPTGTTRPGSTTSTSVSSTTRPTEGAVIPGGSPSGTTTTHAGSTAPVAPGQSDLATEPRLWEELRRLLDPVLAPRLVDLLISPLVLIETVMAAVFRSGRLILLPIAILGALVGWALRRWLPRIRALYADRVPISFLHAKGER